MADPRSSQLDLLMDMEARHDDLMLRLEELDRRVERTLAEWQQHRASEAGSRLPERASAVC
ncbi:MAG: hypothetical protein ABFC63_02425 [Thermoguttaceae bacterium]